MNEENETVSKKQNIQLLYDMSVFQRVLVLHQKIQLVEGVDLEKKYLYDRNYYRIYLLIYNLHCQLCVHHDQRVMIELNNKIQMKFPQLNN